MRCERRSTPGIGGHPVRTSQVTLPSKRWNRACARSCSTTVFSGEAKEWLRYLSLPPDARLEPDVIVRVHLHPDLRVVAFEAEGEDARWLSDLLALGLKRARKRLEDKPKVLNVLDQLLFANARRGERTVTVRLSPDVPSDGTREVPRDGTTGHGETRIVLHSRLVR